MAVIKYRSMFKMARHRKYRKMLTGVALQVHADSMKLAETMIQLFKKPSFKFMRENQISKY